MSIVSKHKAVFTKPPQYIPSRMHPRDAPILGNGDLLVGFRRQAGVSAILADDE